MLNLPRTTHRFFLEPLSNTKHLKKSLKKRFIKFVEKLRKSKKEVLRCVLREIEHDCRSTTGRNIRKLLLESKKHQLSEINVNNHAYVQVPEGSDWKIGMVAEMLNVKAGYLQVTNFTFKELDDICEFLCSSWSYDQSFFLIFCKPILCLKYMNDN